MDDPRTDLTRLTGRWTGEYRLWFAPGEPACTSPTEATITTELDGRGLLLRYDWHYDDAHHHGIAVLVRGDDRVELALGDTFHYGGGVLHCSGAGPALDVLGSYDAAGETWGWRTLVERTADDRLVIRAWNVAPDGAEQLATEARYERVA